VTTKIIGVLLFAIGSATFFAGLFGIPRDFSIPVAIGGVVLLIVGVAVVLFSLRPLRFRAPHFGVIVVVLLATALHAYECFGESSGGFGFLFWSLVPYALCLIVAALSASSIPALAGAIVALLFDLGAHNDVFVHPTSSTAGLALLFVPLWNTLVFVPLAMFAAWSLSLRAGGK
jgi:hypothetical protein